MSRPPIWRPEPGTVALPGRVLRSWLDFTGHTQKWLADEMGVTEKHVSQIVQGKAKYSQRFAITLASLTGTHAGYWAALQATYLDAHPEGLTDA